MGLVDEIVEPSRLTARALQLGAAAARCRGETLRHIKHCIDAASPEIVAEALAREAEAAALLRKGA
jgi:hypothetical protein